MIKKLYPITFPVTNIKRAIEFYENVLGLKKTGEWPNYAIFDVGGVQFGLALGGELEIFLLVDDVDKAFQELKSKGVNFETEPKDEHWGARTAAFVDPDGNRFIIETFKKNSNE